MAENIFFTADMHLAHGNILKWMKRPFASIEEHDEALIDAWNSTVRSKGDRVYVLGDFCWKPTRVVEYTRRLRGRKFLITGNHDKITQTSAKLSRWVWMRYRYTLKVKPHKFVLTHEPIEAWAGMERGVAHLHGHTHNNVSRNVRDLPGRIDVGVDTRESFAPYHIDEILSILGRDHHQGFLDRKNKPVPSPVSP